MIPSLILAAALTKTPTIPINYYAKLNGVILEKLAVEDFDALKKGNVCDIVEAHFWKNDKLIYINLSDNEDTPLETVEVSEGSSQLHADLENVYCTIDPSLEVEDAPSIRGDNNTPDGPQS